MHFSAKRGIAIACRLSVGPSVCLSVCNVGGSGSHRSEILETRTKAHEKLEKRERGCIQGLPNFFRVPPIISGTGKTTDFKFCQNVQSVHPNKSPLKILGKWSVGVPRDCPFFLVPPIISGTGKATNFKFYVHIYGLNRNKSALKFSAKVAVGVVRDSGKFLGHPYIGRIARSSLR